MTYDLLVKERGLRIRPYDIEQLNKHFPVAIKYVNIINNLILV